MRSAQGKDNLPLNSLYISQDLIKCHEENECPSFFSSAPFVVIFGSREGGLMPLIYFFLQESPVITHHLQSVRVRTLKFPAIYDDSF